MKTTRSLTIVLTVFLLTLGLDVRADHVILDDCIIDGSMAVGLDAVNGENFGFDTLRLKENNLRFHFDDTSTAASFPRNDWRLIANDSANGGDSYLGIEDTTEIDPQRPLSELGLDSFMAIDLVRSVEPIAGQKLSPTIVFQYPSLAELSTYIAKDILQLAGKRETAPVSVKQDDALLEEIASMGEEELRSALRNFVEDE